MIPVCKVQDLVSVLFSFIYYMHWPHLTWPASSCRFSHFSSTHVASTTWCSNWQLIMDPSARSTYWQRQVRRRCVIKGIEAGHVMMKSVLLQLPSPPLRQIAQFANAFGPNKLKVKLFTPPPPRSPVKAQLVLPNYSWYSLLQTLHSWGWLWWVKASNTRP